MKRALVVSAGVALVLGALALAHRSREADAIAPSSPGAPALDAADAGIEGPRADVAAPARASASAAASEPTSDPGAESASTAGFDPASAASARLAAADPAGCVLYGRTLDPAGAPIAEAALWLVRADGEELHARSGAHGAFALAGIPPGEWIVRSGARGYRTAALDLAIGAQPTLRRDVTLERSTHVRVLVHGPGGRPWLEQVDVEAQLELHRSLAAVATVDDLRSDRIDPADGAATFVESGPATGPVPPGCLGVLELGARTPRFVHLVLGDAVLASRPLEPDVDEIAFTVDREALRAATSGLECRVIAAETGAPIAGAAVELSGPSGVALPSPVTDAQGRISFSGKAPGRYEITVTAGTRGLWWDALTLRAGETLALDPIALEPGTTIAGRVVDEQGAPTGAALQVGVVEPDGDVRWMRGRMYSARPDGAFEIGTVAPGRYVVRTFAGSASFGHRDDVASANVRASTLAGSVEGLEIVVRPLGRLVLRYDRADRARLVYAALDAEGLARASGSLYDERQIAVSLPHGAYRLRVTGGEEVVLEREIEIGAQVCVVELPAPADGGG